MSSIESHFRRLCKIKASILVPDNRPDLSLFTAEQLDEKLYQLRLEKAVSDGDTAEADKLRRRHEVTLEQLTDRFLSLDISQTEYRHIRTCIGIRGASTYKDEMWRWVEQYV